ncbi:MAG: phosphoribosylanthranilate isomerase [bacterium]|nr:phosphoribosylanthranilate isomerase [bacterium]
MVKVKICGITNKEDALASIDVGCDALGFVFAKSPRRITPEKARKIISALPPFVSIVGVFVDESAEIVKGIADYCKLDVLQFHGNESPSYCKEFSGIRVIKAFRIKDEGSLDIIKGYNLTCYLLDTYVEEGYGGTGKTFNWDLAKKVGMFSRIILSGGLTVDNISHAIKAVHPYGVDVSSGVESRPGKKDHEKLCEFIRQVRLADK